MEQHNCDFDLLRQVLQQDPQHRDGLNDARQQQLETHLSSCETCRQELESIAGQPQFWKTAASALAASPGKNDGFKKNQNASPSVLVQVNSDAPGATSELVHHGVDDTNIVGSWDPLTVLDPPSHPEMLGRIDGFSVEQMIGRGGMGIVFRGFDSELNRPVAIKFLAPQLATSGVARKRFAREAQAAAAVVHPNVVPIHSVNSSPVRPYIVMALVSGRSLQRHVENQGPLLTIDIARIAQQIAAGLAAAHEQGLVHRDIKPANILLEKDVSRVMITDFGLARAADDAALTQTGWLAGTPHYMSPEQASGEGIDHRSDLFSLGSVIYFMATGRAPFRAERSLAVLQKIATKKPASPRSINSDIEPTLEAIIETLMAKEVDDRFQSASEAQEVLTRYLAWLQDPKSHKKPIVGHARSHRLQQAIAMAAVFLATVAVGFGISLLLKDVKQGNSISSTAVTRPVTTQPAQSTFAVSARPEPIAPWVTQSPANATWQSTIDDLEQQIQSMEQSGSKTTTQIDSFSIEMQDFKQSVEQLEKRFGK